MKCVVTYPVPRRALFTHNLNVRYPDIGVECVLVVFHVPQVCRLIAASSTQKVARSHPLSAQLSTVCSPYVTYPSIYMLFYFTCSLQQYRRICLSSPRSRSVIIHHRNPLTFQRIVPMNQKTSRKSWFFVCNTWATLACYENIRIKFDKS